jgi:predicted metal-dependent hydrolase
VTKHYIDHKEEARKLVLTRLEHFNQYYQLEWKRVAIRNQRRCWGSCSSLKNLNFNYKIIFLPDHLQDYIIVHELCHIKHLNHRQDFWDLVAEQVPDYKKCVAELRAIDKLGHSVTILTKIRDHYQKQRSHQELTQKLSVGSDLCEILVLK